MLNRKRICMMIFALVSSGIMYAGQNNLLYVDNYSTMSIDVYVSNRNKSKKTTTYSSNSGIDARTSRSGTNDGDIQSILYKIAPNNSAVITYPQDPRGVVVRFYNPNDPKAIVNIVSFPLADRDARIVIEGNNQTGSVLAPWDPAIGANNNDKPLANSVSLFSPQLAITEKAIYYDEQDVPSTRITRVPMDR